MQWIQRQASVHFWDVPYADSLLAGDTSEGAQSRTETMSGSCVQMQIKKGFAFTIQCLLNCSVL